MHMHFVSSLKHLKHPRLYKTLKNLKPHVHTDSRAGEKIRQRAVLMQLFTTTSQEKPLIFNPRSTALHIHRLLGEILPQIAESLQNRNLDEAHT